MEGWDSRSDCVLIALAFAIQKIGEPRGDKTYSFTRLRSLLYVLLAVKVPRSSSAYFLVWLRHIFLPSKIVRLRSEMEDWRSTEVRPVERGKRCTCSTCSWREAWHEIVRLRYQRAFCAVNVPNRPRKRKYRMQQNFPTPHLTARSPCCFVRQNFSVPTFDSFCWRILLASF